MNWGRVATITRTDLKQLAQARDFWAPMVALGLLFFVVIPGILLLTLTQLRSAQGAARVAEALEVLPQPAKESLRGETPQDQTAFALAVFLFAPVSVVVPLTISTAVGASTIVGERERGTGEFLAHSPADVKEIYVGKLLSSLLPGYATTVAGFAVYSVMVNTIVGPKVGGWFFPTREWWVMVTWIIPPFLALGLSLVLRLSARVKSTAAAQQASGLITLPLIMLAYAQATGTLFGASWTGWAVGSLAWIAAFVALRRGMRSMSRARLLGVADEQ